MPPQDPSACRGGAFGSDHEWIRAPTTRSPAAPVKTQMARGCRLPPVHRHTPASCLRFLQVQSRSLLGGHAAPHNATGSACAGSMSAIDRLGVRVPPSGSASAELSLAVFSRQRARPRPSAARGPSRGSDLQAQSGIKARRKRARQRAPHEHDVPLGAWFRLDARSGLPRQETPTRALGQGLFQAPDGIE